MNINFPPKSTTDSNTFSPAFPVVVDGTPSRCVVSNEVLEDIFGGVGQDPLDVFENNRYAIERAAEKKIRAGATLPIFLAKADF